MTEKRRVAGNCKQTPQTHANAKPQAYYRLHTLLHTVRTITQHEDDLCCLLNEIGNSGEVTPEVSNDLRTLLQEMSSADYHADLNAVWRALSIIPPQRAAARKPKPAKAAAKSAAARKAKKKTAPPARRAPRTRAA